MRPRPPVKGRGIFSGTGVIVSVLAGTVVALLVPLWSYAHRPATPA
ncbi:Tat pathway signal sequence domain protein, partial [Streptomyces spiralis]